MQTLNTLRTVAATLGGVFMTVAMPVLPYAGLCTAMVLADGVTAWSLGRRVARRCGQAARKDAGRLQSRGLGVMLVTLAKVYALLLLASAVDIVIVQGADPDAVASLLPTGGSHPVLRFCAGAVCFWQAVSVLENEAACSDARWARIARRFLIDKARRHLRQ